MENGRRVCRDMEEFDTSGDGVHANWPNRFFAKIVNSFLAKTGNEGGRAGDAMTYLPGARDPLDCCNFKFSHLAVVIRQTNRWPAAAYR